MKRRYSSFTHSNGRHSSTHSPKKKCNQTRSNANHPAPVKAIMKYFRTSEAMQPIVYWQKPKANHSRLRHRNAERISNHDETELENFCVTTDQADEAHFEEGKTTNAQAMQSPQ